MKLITMKINDIESDDIYYIKESFLVLLRTRTVLFYRVRTSSDSEVSREEVSERERHDSFLPLAFEVC